MYRQGDLLFIPTEEKPPEGLRQVQPEEGEVILARGEATGHKHTVPAVGVALLEKPHSGELEERWLQVLDDSGITVKHQEHGDLQLPKGNFRVVRQREHNPDGGSQSSLD